MESASRISYASVIPLLLGRFVPRLMNQKRHVRVLVEMGCVIRLKGTVSVMLDGPGISVVLRMLAVVEVLHQPP